MTLAFPVAPTDATRPDVRPVVTGFVVVADSTRAGSGST
jgi:hypothetical protein